MENDLVLIDGNPSMKVVSAPSPISTSTPPPPPPPPAPPQPLQTLTGVDGKAHLRHDFLWNTQLHPEPNWNVFGAPSHDCNCNTDLTCGSKQKKDFGVMPPPPPPMPMPMPPTLLKSCAVPPLPLAQHPKKSKKKTGLVFSPSPPTPLPPPPPPMPGTHVVHIPPPPPPPPPPMISSNDLTRVSTPGELVPTIFSGDSFTDRSEVVRLTPFNKDVFLTVHKVHAVDFDTQLWLLKYGMMDTWYERPSRTALKMMAKMESCDYEPAPLQDIHQSQNSSESRSHSYCVAVVNLDVPKVCASSALTTPTDDDIYDCEHDESDGEACYQCTDERSEALEKTPLVYFVVVSTYLKHDDFGPPVGSTKGSSRRIHKYIKCGSREAAAAETFHAAGVNGWDVVFSCVMRFGETFEERSGSVERVEDLSKLIDDADDEDAIKVFY